MCNKVNFFPVKLPGQEITCGITEDLQQALTKNSHAQPTSPSPSKSTMNQEQLQQLPSVSQSSDILIIRIFQLVPIRSKLPSSYCNGVKRKVKY